MPGSGFPLCLKATSLSLPALALLSLRRRAAAAAAAAAALAPRRAWSPAISRVATLLRCCLRSCSHAVLHVHALLVPLMSPQAMKRSCNTDSWYFSVHFRRLSFDRTPLHPHAPPVVPHVAPDAPPERALRLRLAFFVQLQQHMLLCGLRHRRVFGRLHLLMSRSTEEKKG